MAIASIQFKPSGYLASKLVSLLPTSGDADLTFSRTDGSGNGSATRVNESGLIELMGENVPRLDYTGGGCPSLLMEQQSTNLITYSEDFSNTSWGKVKGGVSIIPDLTSNYSTSPDGTVNADRFIFDLNGGTTSSDLSQLQSSTFVMNGDYSNSIWLKSNTASSYVMSFLKSNGSVTTITVTTEWQRFENSITVSATTVPIRLRLRGGSESTDVYADISVYGAQLEQQSYSTSYIPTAGATVSRIADSASKTGLSSYINSSEGVFYAEFSNTANDSLSSWLNLSDGTNQNWIFIGKESTDVRAYIRANNVVQFTNQATPISIVNKVALLYKSGSIKLYINGVQIISTTPAFAFSNPLDRINFRSYDGGVTNTKTSWKDVRVYKTEFTDAELTTLTTL